jgi:hypothetical protein
VPERGTLLHNKADADGRPVIEVVVLRELNEFENSPRLSGENSEHTRRLAEVAIVLPPISRPSADHEGY